jgi:hypothetical protein
MYRAAENRRDQIVLGIQANYYLVKIIDGIDGAQIFASGL